eukprot:tig00000042_g15535.t1
MPSAPYSTMAIASVSALDADRDRLHLSPSDAADFERLQALEQAAFGPGGPAAGSLAPPKLKKKRSSLSALHLRNIFQPRTWQLVNNNRRASAAVLAGLEVHPAVEKNGPIIGWLQQYLSPHAPFRTVWGILMAICILYR